MEWTRRRIILVGHDLRHRYDAELDEGSDAIAAEPHDPDGLTALHMRRLGAELGAGQDDPVRAALARRPSARFPSSAGFWPIFPPTAAAPSMSASTCWWRGLPRYVGDGPVTRAGARWGMRGFQLADQTRDRPSDLHHTPPARAADRPAVGHEAAPEPGPGWDFSAVAVHAPTAQLGVAETVAAGLGATARALSPTVRQAMQARLGGEDLSGVRVHTGPAARRSSAALDARAYTVGEQIVLSRDADAADTRSGVLGHELAHVIQNRRNSGHSRAERVVEAGGPAEREAGRSAALSRIGLPSPPIRAVGAGVARTPTSDTVASLISYGLGDWAVTAAEEADALTALTADPDLSRTVADLDAAGMVGALFERIDVPANRWRLLRLMGAKLNAGARAVVEPHVLRLGPAAELQYHLGRFGVPSAAVPFNPKTLESALVGTARTARTGTTGGHLTEPFTGVGATGVIPVTRYAGTFLTTPGVPLIPLVDKALLATGDQATVATYSNPVGGLAGYLATLTPAERAQQAELLLRRQIASVEEASYAGSLPSRAQVIRAAAGAHNLHPQLVAAFILAEQRDQSQAEDAKDYQGATSIMQGNTSIGLGQVVVSTARSNDLFADLLGSGTRSRQGLDATSGPGHDATARLLASDEFNIFAVARYLRKVADQGAKIPTSTLPKTAARFPAIDLAAYAGNSTTWPDDNIRALGSEYTSTPWDDKLVSAWGEFVWEAYQDVKASGVF